MRIRAAVVLVFAATMGLVTPAEARATVGEGASRWRPPVPERAQAAARPGSRRVARPAGLLRATSLCLMLALSAPAAADEDVMTYRPCSPAQFRDAVAMLAKQAPAEGVAVGSATVVRGSDGRPALTVPLTKQGLFSPYTFRVAVPTREPPDESALAQLTRALRGKLDPASARAVEALSKLVVTTPADGSPWQVPNNLQGAAQRLNLPSSCRVVASAPVASPRVADRGGESAQLAQLN